MPRHALLTLLCVLTVACGADAPLSGAADGGIDVPDAAGDIVAELDGSDVVDAARDVSVDADAAAEGDTDAAEDAASDTALDVPDAADTGATTLVDCDAASATAPDWITRDGDRSVVACDGYTLYLRHLTSEVQLEFVPDGRTPVGRSWALADAPGRDIGWQLVDADTAVDCGTTWQLSVDRDTCAMTLDHAAAASLWRFDGDVAAEGDGVRLRFPTAADQRWFGCGENTGPLDRRGTRMTYWSTDAYDSAWGGYAPGADPLYLSVPYCTMQRGDGYLGLFVDHPWRTVFDIASSAPGTFEITGSGPTLALVLTPSDQASAPLEHYTAATGRPMMPPRWALGFHQSRWGYAAAATFETLAAEFRDRALPADVLWFDIQHMRGFRTFTWDPAAFPDPAGLLASLRARGFRSIAIACPGIKVDASWALYRDARDAGVFVRWPDGRDFVGYAWPGESSWPDMSSPQGYAFWRDHVADMARLGLDGIWIDVNEPTTFPEGGGGNTIPDEVLAHGEGLPTTMAELHNVYALLQARATFDGMRDARPDTRPFVLSRAGYAGLQRWAGVWTGDVPSTWHGLRETLPMMLNIGVSGIPLVGSDVGGYSGGASPELYARWFELGFVSPFFRAHVTSGVAGQEPWKFGTEVTDIARYWLEERSRYMPYMYSLAFQAHTRGTPMLRPLWYELPGAADLAAADDQAMLGPWLLAAPVLDEGASRRTVNLPAGRWFELRSDAAYDGPVELDRAMTLAALPLYVREGAILPSREPTQYEGERASAALYLDVWPAAHATTFELFDDDGETALERGQTATTTLTLERDATGAMLDAARTGAFVPVYRDVELRVRRVDAAPGRVALDAVDLPERASLDELRRTGRGWWYDAAARRLYARFAASSAWSLRVDYDPELRALRPAQRIDFEVAVPAGTPLGATIYVASDVTGWEHVPLGDVGADGIARGTLDVPAGEWYFFKFTRGSWETVEKYPDCEEARDRYAPGAAGVRRETVWAWRDVCEGG